MERRRVSWVLLRRVRLCTSWWRHVGRRGVLFCAFAARGEGEVYYGKLTRQTVKKEKRGSALRFSFGSERHIFVEEGFVLEERSREYQCINSLEVTFIHTCTSNKIILHKCASRIPSCTLSELTPILPRSRESKLKCFKVYKLT